MTIPNETHAPLVGCTPWVEQEHFLTDKSSEKLAKKYKKLKAHCKKLEKKLKSSEQRNAELEKLCYEARAEKRFWKTISNSVPKALQLISDVFNAHHRERMLDKQLSKKKHKKSKKYYYI